MERTISSLMTAAEQGDHAASEALFSTLYAELHRLARRELARPGAAVSLGVTTLLHEAYLEMAARLLRIKAQMLLPRSGDEPWEDPRAELVRRLLEYQQMREVVDLLERRGEERRNQFARAYLPQAPAAPQAPACAAASYRVATNGSHSTIPSRNPNG